MQSSIFVETVHYHIMPARREQVKARDRYVVYHEDLYRTTGEQLDPLSLLTGDQYTHVELADTLLERVGGEVLPHLDVMVTSDWVPEFDPEFPAFGPYLHHRWSLKGESFDVTDQGSIAPVLALAVLKDYLLADVECNTGLVLGVEQSTVPQGVEAHFPAPHRSSAGIVRLNKNRESASAEILDATFFNEAQVIDPSFSVQALMQAWCQKFSLTRNTLTLAIRRNTYLYRNFCYWKDLEASASHHVCFLPAQYSCMNLFDWLKRFLTDEAAYGRECLFLDEDVESLAAAAVLIRRL